MSTLSSSSSGWKLVVRKVKKLRNKVDNIVHNYPKLPKTLPREDSLPLQIGSNVSLEDYNTFLDRNESSGYKFQWVDKNVYIVDMASLEHEAVVALLVKYFNDPNNGVKRGPITVVGQPYHHNPSNAGEKIAPDIAVYPHITNVPKPGIQYPGPPPSDIKGFPHARIICEIAVTQGTTDWNAKCEDWMHEQYVRCVFGIKLHNIRTLNGYVHRSMTARLWTRQAPAPPGRTAVPGLAGVSVQEWDFGTLQFNGTNTTLCNALGLPAYQVTIPLPYVFWNPPIVGGTPNTTGYTVVVPPAITVPNFVIDLYDVQQEALEKS